MRLNELLRFNDIIIQCHDFPDADSIATGFALLTYLKDNGKAPRLIYSGQKKITKPNLVLMTEKLSIPLEYVDKIERPELLVTVDCVYTENNVVHFEADNYASIDHHKVAAQAEGLVEIRSNYGSCSAVIAEMLHSEGLNVNDHIDVATALYYGLYMDTNAFSEINHPADKDLRDFAIYDVQLLMLLKNSNITLEELAVAGDAVKSVYFDPKHKFAVTKARPCDPNILGIISDLLIQVENIEVCVVCSKSFRHGIKFSVRGFSKDMRADELAATIANGIGNGGGHAKKAGGFITKQLDDDKAMDFIIKRIESAYESYRKVYTDSLDISAMPVEKYKRLPQVFGFVNMTDILSVGGKICIRTLKADRNIISDDNTVILIEESGGVRPIDRGRFNAAYIETSEPFTFCSVPEYIPRIISTETENNIALSGDIMRFAKKCMSKDYNVILAHTLTENIKLYNRNDETSYMVGQTGDYLVMRENDAMNIYIVPKAQFENEYGKI